MTPDTFSRLNWRTCTDIAHWETAVCQQEKPFTTPKRCASFLRSNDDAPEREGDRNRGDESPLRP
jgi:hypothetical protein